MTGFGDARWQGAGLSISVELRSVNNRFLKISIKTSEAYQSLETEIERTLREVLKRGTIQVQVFVHRQPQPDDYQINVIALKTYLDQLQTFKSTHSLPGEINLSTLLTVPGVVDESGNYRQHDAAEDWLQVSPVLEQALTKLQMMRSDEGRKMALELSGLAQLIADRLVLIRSRAPEVAGDYRKRLHEKLQTILQEYSVSLDPNTLIKEVAIFADRTDIHEEIVRLGSHVEQFHAFLQEKESAGRKLDFLIQEMNREVNTIGSKANDIAITRHVVEMKGAIEKMRELIQNVE